MFQRGRENFRVVRSHDVVQSAWNDCQKATAGFFAEDALSEDMSALRDALRDLPDAVFADVLESNDAYLLVMDLPGVTAGGLTVSVEGNKLVIEAERSKDVPDEFEYVRENRSLFLDAELPLPPDVTESGAEGDISRGVLELRLPKSTAGQGTTIPIGDA